MESSIRTVYKTKAVRIPGLHSRNQVRDAKWLVERTTSFWATYTGYWLQYTLQAEECLYIVQQGRCKSACISIYPTKNDFHAQIFLQDNKLVVCMDEDINLQALLREMSRYRRIIPVEEMRTLLGEIYQRLQNGHYVLAILKPTWRIIRKKYEKFQPHQGD